MDLPVLAGAVMASSAVVSGSVAVVGGAVYRLEASGRCAARNVGPKWRFDEQPCLRATASLGAQQQRRNTHPKEPSMKHRTGLRRIALLGALLLWHIAAPAWQDPNPMQEGILRSLHHPLTCSRQSPADCLASRSAAYVTFQTHPPRERTCDTYRSILQTGVGMCDRSVWSKRARSSGCFRSVFGPRSSNSGGACGRPLRLDAVCCSSREEGRVT